MNRVYLAILMIVPTTALAHPGHDHGGQFLYGLAHPLGGADHLLAMVAIGLLAAQMRALAVWAMPATFLGAILMGGALGGAGVGLPAVEPMILASIVILGVLLAMAVRPPLPVILPAVALFGTAHGWAHGAEGPASGLALYAAGFALATLALHLAGIALGRLLSHGPAMRIVGGGTTVAGLTLALLG